MIKIIRYTETIERSFAWTEEEDVPEIVQGLRNKTLKYVYDDEDRSQGLVIDVQSDDTVLHTSEDYGLVMRRENFRAEVEWPSTGILAWCWDHKDLHGWFTRGLMLMGWIFAILITCKNGSESQAVSVLIGLSIPIVLQTVLLSWIHVKRDGLGA